MNLQIGDNRNQDEENTRFYNFAMSRMKEAELQNMAIMEKRREQKEEDFKKQLPILIVIIIILAIIFL